MENPLEEAVQFIRAGQKQAGRRILIELLRSSPQDERAWIWLAYAMDTPAESARTLRQYLRINPSSQAALQGLQALEQPSGALEQPPLPAPDLSMPPDSLVEKTRPVKVNPGAVPAESGDEAGEAEPLYHGATPASKPKKMARFWVAVSVLSGILMLAVIGLVYWLWAGGNLSLPGLAMFAPPGLATGTVPAPAGTRPAAPGTATPQPSPTRTLPPTLWDAGRLPVISSSNAAQLGRLAAWPEEGVFAFSPDWEEMAVFNGKSIQIWDVSRKTRTLTLLDPAETVTDLGYVPGSSLLAAASQAQQVQVWDSRTGELLYNLAFKAGDLAAVSDTVQDAYSTATYLSFSPDGRYIGATTYGLAAVWETKTGRMIQAFTLKPAELETFSLEGPDAAIQLEFSPDGKSAALRMVGKIVLQNLPAGEETRSLLVPGALGMRYSPDGKTLLEAGNGYVVLWDLESGEDFLYIKGNYNADYAANAAVFSPDGKRLAVEASGEGSPVEVQVWDIPTRQKEAAFPVFLERLYTLDFSPDGRLLAGGGSEGLARIWDLESGSELVQFDGIHGLFFSPGGRELAGFRGSKLEILGIQAEAAMLGKTPTPSPTPTEALQ